MKPFFQKVINESLESEFLIEKHNGYPEKRLRIPYSLSHETEMMPKGKKLLIIEMYHC